MSTKLFIGGLSWNTNDDGLRDAFARFGEVVEAKVVTDRETGRSRGFGFVTFNDEQDAQNCMDEMDNSEFDGRTIKVNLAHQKSSNHSRAPRNDWR